MLVAVHLLVVLEHAVAGPGAHEVVVALTGGEAAAHRGPCLVAAFTALWSEESSSSKKKQKSVKSGVHLDSS